MFCFCYMSILAFNGEKSFKLMNDSLSPKHLNSHSRRRESWKVLCQLFCSSLQKGNLFPPTVVVIRTSHLTLPNYTGGLYMWGNTWNYRRHHCLWHNPLFWSLNIFLHSVLSTWIDYSTLQQATQHPGH